MSENWREMRFGARTALENLDRAVDSGRVIREADGRYRLPAASSAPYYLYVRSGGPPCIFLNAFLFQTVYDGRAVPHGCRQCYKIKLAAPTLRGLVAVRGLLETLPHVSKCGIDFFNPHSRVPYAAYLYFDGLDQARAAYADFRQRVDEHPHLGPSLPMTIKRGCSNYEASVGPSDRWCFAPGLAELEAELMPLFRLPASVSDYHRRRMASFVHWLQFAWNLGDDTYLDYTGGRPLHPAGVSYAPVGS